MSARRAIALLATGVLLSGSAAFGADPQLMNLVMPDAKVLAGMNVTNAKISPLAQFILTQAPGTDQHLQAFIAATGFDPRQDIAEVLAASAGDPAHPSGLLLIRGTFPVEKIVAAAAGHRGVTVETYAGARLITATGPKQKMPHAVAFLGTTIAVTGDAGNVKAALDRNSASNSIDPALAVKVNALSNAEDAWFVSAAPALSFLPGNVPAAQGPIAGVLPMLKSIQSSSGGVKLGSNVQITAEAVTLDAQSATALASVIQLLKILAASSPQLQKSIQIIQGIQVTTQGPAVDLALSVPESQIEAFLTSLPKRQTASAQNSPRRVGRRAQQN